MGNVLVGVFVVGVGAFLVAAPVLVKRADIPAVWAGTTIRVGKIGFVLWSMLVVVLGLITIVLGLATLLH